MWRRGRNYEKEDVLHKLFKSTNKVDMALMIFNTLGALGDWMSMQPLLISTSVLGNMLGNRSTVTDPRCKKYVDMWLLNVVDIDVKGVQ